MPMMMMTRLGDIDTEGNAGAEGSAPEESGSEESGPDDTGSEDTGSDAAADTPGEGA